MADDSTIINGAVAVGTIGLSLLTVYQTQLLIRERRATQARELAEKIYAPLREPVLTWQRIEYPSFTQWRQFKSGMPYLTLRVPKELTTLLDQGDEIIDEMIRLQEKVRSRCEEKMGDLGWELALSKGQQTTLKKETTVNVLVKNNAILRLDYNNLPTIWGSGKDLYTWILDYFTKNLPDTQWSVDLLVGGTKFGGLEEAKLIVGELFEDLAQQPYAKRLRERAEALKPIGVKASQRIDKELQKAASLER